jgi:hypothetical protein
MWCYSCVRVKNRGISLFDVRMKDLASNTIGKGVSLQGATSKRDSTWHNPVFICMRANRIPVKISKGSDMKYENMCVQTLCRVTLRSDVKETIIDIGQCAQRSHIELRLKGSLCAKFSKRLYRFEVFLLLQLFLLSLKPEHRRKNRYLMCRCFKLFIYFLL